MFKLLVTGGRGYVDRDRAFQVLDWLHATYGVTTVIHAVASGSASLASVWCKVRSVSEIECLADWAKHGKAAGQICNQQMLIEHEPDLVFAFPGRKDTENMCKLAHAAGVMVLRLEGGGVQTGGSVVGGDDGDGDGNLDRDQLGSDPRGSRLF